jgi:hypothetical protein
MNPFLKEGIKARKVTSRMAPSRYTGFFISGFGLAGVAVAVFFLGMVGVFTGEL